MAAKAICSSCFYEIGDEPVIRYRQRVGMRIVDRYVHAVMERDCSAASTREDLRWTRSIGPAIDGIRRAPPNRWSVPDD